MSGIMGYDIWNMIHYNNMIVHNLSHTHNKNVQALVCIMYIVVL